MADPVTAFLDTNVIVRVVTLDGGAEEIAAAIRILQNAADGRLRLDLRPMMLAETAFVLSKHYKLGRVQTATVLRKVLARRGVRCTEGPAMLRTLELWERRAGLHFVDCYLIASAEAADASVATLDGGIARAGLVPVIDGAA